MLMALHHVQLAMPEGGEDQARAFYAGLLGLTEVDKPAALRARGGVWFEQAGLRLHIGTETPFHPARKAHPAFQTDDLDCLAARLTGAGVDLIHDTGLPGCRRLYASDPFGNRIEFLQVK
jgi:catechol 2,3-dioxygenase-like lactoylglutathione lyase family enzyme